MKKGEVIGGESVFDQSQPNYESSYIMTTEGVISLLPYDKFIAIIGGNLESAKAKNANSHEVNLNKRAFNNGQDPSIAKMQLKDLVVVKELGKGQYGRVYLVKEHNKPQLFALKSISKSQVAVKNLQKYILVTSSSLDFVR